MWPSLFIIIYSYLQKIIIICFALAISCSFLPESVGKYNEIIVIVSPEDKPFIERMMINLFSHTIYTPQPEMEFNLRYHNPWEIDDFKKHGNIIIVSLNYPQDSTGDYLMRRILSTNKKEESLFVLGNLYAKNQLVCVLNTLDAISMENEINDNREWILHEFRDLLIAKMKLTIFKHGENIKVSKQISRMFGYTLNLQPDYTIIKSDSLQPFIWIGRGYPYRWITVHKSKKSKYIQKDNAWNQLSLEFADLMPNIKIGDNVRSAKRQIYNDKVQYIMRGVYEHDESESGGPFFVYIFETNSVNEVILVGGFVNHPGHEKLLLLKSLEIIANTLHIGDT